MLNLEEFDWPKNHIRHYINTGWKKVCTIKSTMFLEWYYEDIDRELMFSKHTSWVYAIVVNGIIEKIGETGHPLGIEGSWSYDPEHWESQPKHGTKSRFGRYRKGDGTDEWIRRMLEKEVKTKKVEFWAFPCPDLDSSYNFLDETIHVKAQIHKQLEKKLLDYFKKHTGDYPRLNTGRC